MLSIERRDLAAGIELAAVDDPFLIKVQNGDIGGTAFAEGAPVKVEKFSRPAAHFIDNLIDGK